MFNFYSLLLQFLVVYVLDFIPHISGKIVRLDLENFEDHVLGESTPWIIGISNRVSGKALEKTYEEVKDRIMIGIINEKEYISLLKQMGASAGSLSFKSVRLYPFGPRIHKWLRWEDTDSLEVAVDKAFASFPDITNKISNIVDNKNTELRNFIQEAYSNIPPKFPVILFTGEGGGPVFYRLIALKFSTLFHFGLIENPPSATLAAYNVFELPQLVVMLTEILDDGTPRIRPIPYKKEVHGPLDYAHVMRFLYLVHKKFFNELLKHSHRSPMVDFDIDDLFEPHMTKFPELLQLPRSKESVKEQNTRHDSKDSSKNKVPCSTNVDACIIIVGKDIGTTGSESSWNDIVANLNEIKGKVSSQGKAVKIFEIDIKCNEEMELAFDIYTGDVPVVLVLRPKKQLYTIAAVGELPVTLFHYVEQALLGNMRHYKYDSLPAFKTGKCVSNHSADEEEKLKQSETSRKDQTTCPYKHQRRNSSNKRTSTLSQ